MYLSRLILDLNSRQVQKELAQPYEMHRTLMHAFDKYPREAKEKARDKFGVLFRADVDRRRDCVKVYLQSVVEPDWVFLMRMHDYLLDEADLGDTDSRNPACKKIAGAYERLHHGQVFSFRLRANPTKRIGKPSKGDDELKGKRVGLLREEEQIQWLVRRGKNSGFEILVKEVEDENGEIHQIPRVRVCPEGKQRGRKREDGHSREMTHLAVCFDGLLRITNADAFRETLASGIGPAEAFGFGLLSIAPVRE